MPTEVVSVNCTVDVTPESVSLITSKGSCPKPAVVMCFLKLASGDLEFIGALDIAPELISLIWGISPDFVPLISSVGLAEVALANDGALDSVPEGEDLIVGTDATPKTVALHCGTDRSPETGFLT